MVFRIDRFIIIDAIQAVVETMCEWMFNPVKWTDVPTVENGISEHLWRIVDNYLIQAVAGLQTIDRRIKILPEFIRIIMFFVHFSNIN